MTMVMVMRIRIIRKVVIYKPVTGFNHLTMFMFLKQPDQPAEQEKLTYVTPEFHDIFVLTSYAVIFPVSISDFRN